MEEIKEKVNYCLNCKIKPCSLKGCPLENNIPDFIKAVKEEEYMSRKLCKRNKRKSSEYRRHRKLYI